MKKKVIISLIFLLILSSIAYADITTNCSNVAALYHLDGNANDSSGNGNDGTVNGATYNSSGKVNGAFDFDGDDDYVNVNNDPIGIGAVTVSVWVYSKTTGEIGYGTIVSNGKFMCNLLGWDMGIGCSNDNGNTLVWSESSSLLFNEWQLFTAVRDVDGSFTFYINGIQSGIVNQDGGPVLTGSGLTIGRRYSPAQHFNGSIDEVIIYNRALNSTEISELYNSGLVGTPVTCGSCTSQTCVDLGYECGSGWSDGCGRTLDCDIEVGGCTGGDVCSSGICIPPPSCTDNDGDGYNQSVTGCGTVDCNDSDATINPGATETCGNTIDEDCSGDYLTCSVSESCVSGVCQALPQCNNGLDDDGDGFCDTIGATCTDGSTPGDPDCSGPSDNSESPVTDIVPDDRRITWEGNVGVEGGIPERTTICATLSETGDTTDRTSEIQSALDSCGSDEVVYLNTGTYYVGSKINMPSNVTIRGAGQGLTIIKTLPGFSSVNVFHVSGGTCLVTDNTGNCGPWRDVISGLTKGSTQLSATDHGWNINDYLIIDRLNDPNGIPPVDDFGATHVGRNGRAMAQVVKVINKVSNDVVDIYPQLYHEFDISYSPQAMKLDAVIMGVGIESLTIDAMTSSQGGNTAGHVWFINAVDSWLYDIELHGVMGRAVWLYQASRITIKKSEIHEKPDHVAEYGTNGGYGIFVGPHASDNLIEDNTFHKLVLPISMEGADAGNVISYNYITDNRWDPDSPSCRVSVLGHGGHSMMNLYEGNIIDDGRIGFDQYFGTHSYYTIFRNRIEQERTPCSFFRLGVIDIQRKHHFMNILGNVLGTLGWEDHYERYNEPYSDSTNSVIYRTGYSSESEDFTGGDTGVFTTMFRHKNFDYFTNSIKKCNEVTEPGCYNINPDAQLPNSLYLSSKPSWFGGLSWPPIGPDVNPMNGTIPARERFYGRSVVASCTDTDGDGYGNPASNDCTYPDLDCNDNNPSIHPNAIELCNLNVDDNCDGIIQCHNADYLIVDGCVDENEVDAFVQRWFASSADVSMSQLISAIRVWKQGCN